MFKEQPFCTVMVTIQVRAKVVAVKYGFEGIRTDAVRFRGKDDVSYFGSVYLAALSTFYQPLQRQK